MERPISSVFLTLTLLVQTGISAVPAIAAGDSNATTTVSLGASVLRVSSDSEYRQNADIAKCPAGYVVVSIGYQDSDQGNSDVVSGMGIICAKLESNGTLGARTGRIYAGPLGSRTFYDIGCPAGMVVYGAYTRDFPLDSENSDFLDGYSPQCRKISSLGLGAIIGYLGNSDLDASKRNQANFQCASGEVVTGLVRRRFDGKYKANTLATDSYDWYCAKVIVITTYQSSSSSSSSSSYPCSWCSLPPYSSSSSSNTYSSSSNSNNNNWMWNWANNQNWNWGN